MSLTPDKVEKINGVTIKQYFLTKHNINKISMPSIAMTKPIGITIHNIESINTTSNVSPAEQYTNATINDSMGTVRTHFYIDELGAWQNLPLNLSGWHAADENGDGNKLTISFEIIGNSLKAEANAIKLAAYFLKKYGKTVENGLFTHTYWFNIKDGKKGDIDFLNTLYNSNKTCPAYIIPHWSTFKEKVKEEFEKLCIITDQKDTISSLLNENLYRIRKKWNEPETEIGAYPSLDIAKKEFKKGYFIYDSKGVQIYPKNTLDKERIDVFYRVFSKDNWTPEIKNLENYAGIEDKIISAVSIKTLKGQIRYRVHQFNSNWMNWIYDYNTSNVITGCAGLPGIPIDGIQIQYTGEDGYDVRYRVAARGQDYYPWVYGKDQNKFAGYAGKYLDRLQIEIISE